MTMLDRLRELRAAIAADPLCTLYEHLDPDGADDAVQDALNFEQARRHKLGASLTQADRLVIVDAAIDAEEARR